MNDFEKGVAIGFVAMAIIALILVQLNENNFVTRLCNPSIKTLEVYCTDGNEHIPKKAIYWNDTREERSYPPDVVYQKIENQTVIR